MRSCAGRSTRGSGRRCRADHGAAGPGRAAGALPRAGTGAPRAGSGACAPATPASARAGTLREAASAPSGGPSRGEGSSVRRLTGLIKRLAWIAVIVVVAVVAVGTSLVGALTLRGFPTTNGTLSIAGLEHEVRVSRDASGIAWIEAETPHDLFLAQGYVHAQERMWQMEVWRHISAGRLSELFGPSTAHRGPLHPDAGLAAGGPARPGRARSRGAGRRRCLCRGRQRLDRRPRRIALAAVRRDRVQGRDRRLRRLPARAVDRPRHARLAEGPGVAARRQLRQRDLPDAGRREARRSGPDRRAVSRPTTRRCR